MSLNNLELIIAKLERIVRANSAQLNAESIIVDDREKQEICNLINLRVFVEPEQSVIDKHLPPSDTFIRHLPLAIAILDRDMNYLAISDRAD